MMKLNILIYLIGGLICWVWTKRFIRNIIEDKFPYINPDFIEGIMLIFFLIGWLPIIACAGYRKIKYNFVSFIFWYRLKRKMSPGVWKLVKEEMDKKREEVEKYKNKK